MYNENYIKKSLKEIYKDNLLIDEPLSKHTSFKIGGKAKFLVKPKKLEEIIKTYLLLTESHVPFYVLGNGTNVLASDNGFNGVIIKLDNYAGIENVEGIIHVLSGTSLSKVVNYVNELGLQGMEDGYGIPGTIGGAVIMNASAYNYETSHFVLGVLAIIDGKITYLKNEELQFSYRNSIFKNYKDAIILRVDLKFDKVADSEELKKRSAEIMQMRINNQPLNYPSAGSVFKRINGVIVSKLIDEAGLKGYTVNDAQVSTKHAGFIVNLNKATCNDVISVIKHVKQVIFEKHGLQLEEEIKYIN